MNQTILNQLAMVRLDVTIWGGRARLNRSDLQDSRNLPPQAMATLGSKKLFDPTQLRVFNTLKARAVRFLDCNGTRFLGGWATDEDKLGTINTELENVRQEFNQAVAAFLLGYESGVQEWAANFPEYERILLQAVPSLHAMTRKFGFAWQTFKVTPVAQDTEGNNLTDVIDDLNNTAMQEVADMIKDIYEQTFKGRTTITRKQFRPFNNLMSKLQSLSFIDPQYSGLHDLLNGLVTGYADRCDDPTFVSALSALLVAMSNVDGIKAIVEPFANGQVGINGSLDAAVFMTMPEPVMTDPVVDGMEPVDMPLIELPVFDEQSASVPVTDLPPVENTLDDGGLW